MSLFPKSVVYPPMVGKKKIITLVGEIKRIKDPGGEGNYKDKNRKDQGYYDLIPILDEEGQEVDMKNSTWKLYFALKDNGIDIGDTIEIDHLNDNVYNITKK